MIVSRRVAITLAALMLSAGCSWPVVREHALPSKTKDQYTRIKRVAISPLENYSDTKDAEKTIDSLMTTYIRETGVFEQIEDIRFVRDTMKKLKIISTDILDKEQVKKLADELNVQGIVYGKVLAYGKGKEKDSGSQLTIDLSLLEPSTGAVLWVGNVTVYGGLTAGKVFGVTEGKTDIEVAREGVRRLVRSMASEVEDARKREAKGILSELKKEQDLERAKLEKIKGETGKIQADIDKAKAEARGIRESATKDAEKTKTELELQKAAFETEKSKTQAAQQEIDQEKLKVELERKKVAEDLKKIEDEKKALEEARRKAAEAKKAAEAAPAATAPAAPPVPEPAPAPAPVQPSVTPAAPPVSEPAPAPTPVQPPGTPAAPPVPEPAPAPPAGKTGQ